MGVKQRREAKIRGLPDTLAQTLESNPEAVFQGPRGGGGGRPPPLTPMIMLRTQS